MLAPALGGEAVQAPQGLTPSPPVVCRGNENIVLRDRYIQTDGNGVELLGNCNVQILGSRIVAGGMGVVVRSNSDVYIEGSHVEGAGGALVVTGNGNIRFRRTTVRGGTRVTGHGGIIDLGDSEVGGAAPGSRAEPGTLTLPGVEIGPGGVRVKEGKETVVVGSGGVEVKDRGDKVTVGAGGVEVRDRTGDKVTAGAGGVAVQDRSGERVTVVAEGDYVRIQSEGATVTLSDHWRSAASRYTAADTDRILLELGAKQAGGEILFDLAGDILFDFDSAIIRRDAATDLSKVAHVLRQRAASTIVVVGHTDSKGADDHNQKLSESRAVSVMNWLRANESIPVALMKGRGMGSKKPIAYNTMPDGSDNPEGRARNRRVEIRFEAR
jgi:outer membrane protein OmpA-like peptidoglycan-associated protein